MQRFYGRIAAGLMSAMCCLLVGTVCGTARAQIIMGQEVKLDFTKPESVKGRVDYSGGNDVALSDKGLGLDGPAGRIAPHVWFQTTEPIALGMAWTPTAGVTIHAHLAVDFADIGAYSLGVLYVRHSPDAEHWSPWQVMMGSARSDKSRLTHDYDGQLVVPYREREAYFALLTEFNKANPELAGDEEFAVRSIVGKDPRYFEKNQPFVGYIQFLFEAPLFSGQHLKSLNALVIWTLPGIHSVSKRERDHDPKAPMAQWSYRAVHKAETPVKTPK